MAKCLMVFYSGSGTTANLARHIARGLRSTGFEVDLCNIADVKPPDIHEYDLIGLGSPVYFFNPVTEIRKYIEQIPSFEDIPVFLFMSYGTDRNRALNKMRRFLSTKGALDAGAIVCRNANFILGPVSGGILSLDAIKTEELVQAVNFGSQLGKRFQVTL